MVFFPMHLWPLFALNVWRANTLRWRQKRIAKNALLGILKRTKSNVKIVLEDGFKQRVELRCATNVWPANFRKASDRTFARFAPKDSKK